MHLSMMEMRWCGSSLPAGTTGTQSMLFKNPAAGVFLFCHVVHWSDALWLQCYLEMEISLVCDSSLAPRPPASKCCFDTNAHCMCIVGQFEC